MTLEKKDREEIIKHRIGRAYETINEVEFLLKNNKFSLAVSRIYYGSFYILSALALQHSFETSRHGKLIGWFNKEFIKTGEVDKKHGQFIHKVFDKRSMSDYADFVEFLEDEVDALFIEMKKFINIIHNLINKDS